MRKDDQFAENFSSPSPHSASVPAPSSTKGVTPGCDDPPCRSLSILIAEDDPVSRLFLARVLNKLGHNVHSVANGREVLDLLKSRERYDLLLTDIKMPLVNGVDLSRILRSDRRYHHRLDLIIVAMTAYGAPGDRANFLKAGMDDFLPKPIDGRLLKIMLDQFVSNTQ